MKWIGGFLGLLHGGPLGALAGFVLGAIFDSFTERSAHFTVEERQAYEPEGERNGFLFSMMVLSAHIIHADRKIMHSEMEYVRRFLRTNFSAAAESQGQDILLRLFEQKKQMGPSQWDAQIQAVCRQIAGVMPQEQRLQLIAFLCEIAKADGHIATEEREALRRICLHMNLDAGLHKETHHILFAFLNASLNLIGTHCERILHLHASMSIVLEIALTLALGLQLLRGIESIIGLATIKKLLNILLINITTLTLTIGTMRASKAHPLVKLDAQPAKRFENIFFGSRHKTMGVSVFNAKYKVAAMLAGKQIIIEGRTHSTNVKGPCRTGCKPHSHSPVRHIFSLT